MLTTVRAIVADAMRHGYAVPAIDTPNLEVMRAACLAAEQQHSPVIVQATEHDVAYAGARMLVAMARELAAQTAAPVALHLDHTAKPEVVKAAIEAGFTSVMIDASLLPYRENVRATQAVVKMARRHRVLVQAELGQMLEHEAKKILARGQELKRKDFDHLMTDPEQAVDFVRRTGVDTLAVAIGSLHGAVKYAIKNPHLDFKRLATIDQRLAIPLVLHGGSDLSPVTLRHAVQQGIRIVNFRTDVNAAFTRGLQKALQKNQQQIDPRKYLSPATMTAQRLIGTKMRILGCAGKAKNF